MKWWFIAWVLCSLGLAALILDARCARAEEAQSLECMEHVINVNTQAVALWNRVKYDDWCKDQPYSLMDFSKVYWDLMRRMPRKYDRTRGAYLELEDRHEYMRKVLFSYRYRNCEQYYPDAQQLFWAMRNLGYCYGR